MDLDDDQLLRYSRQIMLPQVDAAGQLRLLESSALIIGLGGLGSPAAMYLAAAGVGRLVLVDHDDVDLTNLQRQIIHTTPAIGHAKVESARERIAALNPEVTVEIVDRMLEGAALEAQVRDADVVLDCTDNFEARFAINAACVAAGRPLVSGAAVRWEGQVSVFNRGPGSPCYRCLYREEGGVAETCSENGILAPVVGIIGAVQAVEAIKLLVDAGDPLDGRLLLLDTLHMEWREVRLRRDPGCPVCGIRRQMSEVR